MARKRAAKMATRYHSASGPDSTNCSYLGQCYLEEWGSYKPLEGESWVLSHSPEPDGDVSLSLNLGSMAWLTQLWRAPSGKVFISNATRGTLLSHPDPAGDLERQFDEEELGPSVEGVWGLDDNCVFAWGSTSKETRHFYRYDGKKWKDMAAPDFDVYAVHGLEPDLLYAVGVGGGVARWDGRKWKRFPVPTDEILGSVFVAGPDEIYATGGAGSLLEGSAHGWGKIAQGPVEGMPLLGVAKWKKGLWVAGGQFGLLKRVGTKNKLECIKPNLRAVSLDARKSLLIGCEDVIAHTLDGKEFRGSGRDFLQEERAGKRIGDF